MRRAIKHFIAFLIHRKLIAAARAGCSIFCISLKLSLSGYANKLNAIVFFEAAGAAAASGGVFASSVAVHIIIILSLLVVTRSFPVRLYTVLK